MDILKPRVQTRFGYPEAAALLLFVLFAFLCVPYHEPWFDETQAWLIVRDSSLKDILLHRLHYEGAPAVWYLLLWMIKLLHISYRGMQFIAATIAVAGVYVWLRFNPLPRAISLLVPFGFFVQYQYALICRSYVLFPLLAFSMMTLYQDRRSKPLSYCVLAGLLANCSLHMAAFAGGAVLFFVASRWESHPPPKTSIFRKLAAPALVLLIAFTLAAATAWPTPDGSFGNKVIDKLRVPSGNGELPPLSVPRNDYPQPLHQGRAAAALWHVIYPPPAASHHAIIVGKLVERLLRFITVITVPVSTSNILALVFLSLLFWNLWRYRLVYALTPYVLVVAICIVVWGSSHHLGIVWISLVCALWTVADADLQQPSERRAPLLALYCVSLLVVSLQVVWSVVAIHRDIRLPYSSSLATANFLRLQPVGTTIAGFDPDSTSVNVFLSHSPYINQSLDYWPYSRTHDPNLYAAQVIAQNPDLVVTEYWTVGSLLTNQWFTLADQGTVQLVDPLLTAVVLSRGYTQTHRFCGEHLFRNAVEENLCLAVYERPKSIH